MAATSNVTQPGIIVTQVGINAKTAADYQMVFNSNWPSLQIAFSTNVTIPGTSVAQVAHGLKFFPFTMVWPLQNGISIGRDKVTVEVDATYVYVTGAPGLVASIKCYNIDLTDNKNYELPSYPQVNRPYDNNYGIKVAKFGSSIESKDLRNFILHSRAQSPAILSTNTKPQLVTGDPNFNGNIIRYINPAGYTPWVWAYAETGFGTPGTMQLFAPGGNQVFPAFVQINKTSYILPNNVSAKMDLLVFRDPLVVATNIRVVY